VITSTSSTRSGVTFRREYGTFLDALSVGIEVTNGGSSARTVEITIQARTVVHGDIYGSLRFPGKAMTMEKSSHFARCSTPPWST
jgi:hypothetical protein